MNVRAADSDSTPISRSGRPGLCHTCGRRLLQDFVAYLAQHGDGPPIRAYLAVDWACRASTTRGPSGQHARLSVARGFLLHLKASLPETEIPDRTLIARHAARSRISSRPQTSAESLAKSDG